MSPWQKFILIAGFGGMLGLELPSSMVVLPKWFNHMRFLIFIALTVWVVFFL